MRRLSVHQLDPDTGLDGQGIVIAGGKFVIGDVSGSVASLDDLTDVDVVSTPPAEGQVLVYDGRTKLWHPADAAAPSQPTSNAEQLVADGVTPPTSLTNDAEDDWLYQG